MKDVILVCSDLFGLEVLTFIQNVNAFLLNSIGREVYRVVGYVSDQEKPFRDIACGVPRLGTLADHSCPAETRYVLGIREPHEKERAVGIIRGNGGRFWSVYSPWMLAPSINIGVGSVVNAYSIKAGMTLGPYTTIMESMLTSDHVGAFSTILRFSNITGNVGERTLIGNCAYSHLGVPVGDDAVVMDGSIVVKQVKNGNRVSGVPARKVR